MVKASITSISVVALMVLLAACGSSDTKTATASGPSKADYIAEADTSCKVANATVETSTAEVTGDITKGDFVAAAAATQKILETQQASLDAVKALPRPSGSDAELNALFAAQDKTFVAVAAFIEVIKGGNISEILAGSQKALPLQSAAEELAKKFGFKSCAITATDG